MTPSRDRSSRRPSVFRRQFQHQHDDDDDDDDDEVDDDEHDDNEDEDDGDDNYDDYEDDDIDDFYDDNGNGDYDDDEDDDDDDDDGDYDDAGTNSAGAELRRRRTDRPRPGGDPQDQAGEDDGLPGLALLQLLQGPAVALYAHLLRLHDLQFDPNFLGVIHLILLRLRLAVLNKRMRTL